MGEELNLHVFVGDMVTEPFLARNVNGGLVALVTRGWCTTGRGAARVPLAVFPESAGLRPALEIHPPIWPAARVSMIDSAVPLSAKNPTNSHVANGLCSRLAGSKGTLYPLLIAAKQAVSQPATGGLLTAETHEVASWL